MGFDAGLRRSLIICSKSHTRTTQHINRALNPGPQNTRNDGDAADDDADDDAVSIIKLSAHTHAYADYK